MNSFVDRHIGLSDSDIKKALEYIEVGSIEELINQTIPNEIRLQKDIELPEALSEQACLRLMNDIASKNQLYKTYLGQGYYGTNSPSVIIRNIFENPSWYTSYTPYQAEISQGRLEALLNFQTMVMELTAMPIANASLLDEGTAAAEAMLMLYNNRDRALAAKGIKKFIIDPNVFIQTISVVESRAKVLGIEIINKSFDEITESDEFFGVLVQYPSADGSIRDFENLAHICKNKNAALVVAADLLSLTLLTPPGEWGADVVVGSSQRFGIPMGYGGPHAAFFATNEKYKRAIPGRIIGVSKDAKGNLALRMALQTREQHIKREKATSNICTAQALLATMAGMYAVYHGGEGLKSIALRIHIFASTLYTKLKEAGFQITSKNFFDTLQIQNISLEKLEKIRKKALNKRINLHYSEMNSISISLDETVEIQDLNDLLEVFGISDKITDNINQAENEVIFDPKFIRKSDYLQIEVFNRFHTETEMMRYIKKLEKKDISLTHSMISLGSCTMKLNAATEMLPLSWGNFANIHPFVPSEQAEGYHIILNELKSYLGSISGLKAVSLQPNSGASGEYAGLLVIKAYHASRNDENRNFILIPASAHGTNPASAVMAGYQVVVVACDKNGNIDFEDFLIKIKQYSAQLAGMMITYPSTHGVFETNIVDICQTVHQHGGLVYMDGANMNAQVGLTNPGKIGADVCHINLHKTFAIPHGGGGPGAGPICVKEDLAKFLPGHPYSDDQSMRNSYSIASAPFGSAFITLISFAYIRMMGTDGLKKSTQIAILNANYLAAKLKNHFEILYRGENGRVAHEMIIDCRPLKSISNITEIDIAKRLMDYGFHAPTVSFPVHGTLMIEPTESESIAELDRFAEAIISIHSEIHSLQGHPDWEQDNVLKNAPHTLVEICSDTWTHPYTRQAAAFPLSWIVENKYWPAVSRLDDAYGDRNLFCSCSMVWNS